MTEERIYLPETDEAAASFALNGCLYDGGEASRIYDGRYQVRVTYAVTDHNGDECGTSWDVTEPMTYEEAARMCGAFSRGLGWDAAGYGLPAKPHRVTRALIGPEGTFE